MATASKMLTDPALERALKLWVVLARSYGAVSTHSKRDIARHDLTGGEFAVMEALYHGGPMLLGEVQRKILISSGGITYLVDRLQEKGFVERRPCQEDRRALYAHLTPQGSARMEEIFPPHARCIQKAVSGLNAEEQEQAIQLLRKLGLAAAALERCAQAAETEPAG